MILYTIGFTHKSAESFFGIIQKNRIRILIDVRLNNKSQLAGFTKEADLKYFLNTICNCEYEHLIQYAPTKEILDGYKKRIISWNQYVRLYNSLIESRGDYKSFFNKYSQYQNVCLLCSESSAEHCHRRLAAEMIAQVNSQIVVEHI